MITTSESRPATTPAATQTYAKCGDTPQASSGCQRDLVTIDEQRRGVCADFPMCR